MTIGEVVAQHYRTAEVFSRNGIDFCCGGKKTLGKACSDHQLDWAVLSAELGRAIEAPEMPSQQTDRWEPDFLAEYIVQTHHRYLRENLPLLLEYTAKIAKVHGARHPELLLIARQVQLLSTELLEHLDKEEGVLFPYVAALCAARRQERETPAAVFGTVANPIGMMEHEHDYAGALLDNIRDLTANFTPPPDACATYRVAFAKLRELDQDLRWHVHLENNVLFPKTISMEQLLRHSN